MFTTRRSRGRQRGQSLIEYAALIGTIVVILIAAVAAFGPSVNTLFTDTVGQVAGIGDGSGGGADPTATPAPTDTPAPTATPSPSPTLTPTHLSISGTVYDTNRWPMAGVGVVAHADRNMGGAYAGSTIADDQGHYTINGPSCSDCGVPAGNWYVAATTGGQAWYLTSDGSATTDPSLATSVAVGPTSATGVNIAITADGGDIPATFVPQNQ